MPRIVTHETIGQHQIFTANLGPYKQAAESQQLSIHAYRFFGIGSKIWTKGIQQAVRPLVVATHIGTIGLNQQRGSRGMINTG